LAEKITVAPGPIFSAKQGFQNFLRISFAMPWSETIERAVARLGNIMATMKPCRKREDGELIVA
jgi:DNA-binding transcriptional MocR family regulator